MEGLYNEDEERNFTDKAWEIIEILECGMSISDAAEIGNITEDQILQWLKEPEFAEQLNWRKNRFESELKKSVNIKVKPLTISKKDMHHAFRISCDFLFHGTENKKHREMLIFRHLMAIKEAAMEVSIPKEKAANKD